MKRKEIPIKIMRYGAGAMVCDGANCRAFVLQVDDPDQKTEINI